MNSSSCTRFILFDIVCTQKLLQNFEVLNLHKFNLIAVDTYRRLFSKSVFKFPLIFLLIFTRENCVKKIRIINLIIHSLIRSCSLTYSPAKIHISSNLQSEKYCKSNYTREILKGCAPLLFVRS